MLGATIVAMLGVATAQEEVCAPYGLGDLQSDLNRIDASMREAKLPLAYRSVQLLRKELRCLEVPIPRRELHRFQQQAAVVHFFDQDAEQMRIWGLAQRYAGGSEPWPEYCPPVLIDDIEALEDVELTTVDGQRVNHANGTAVLMNGQLLESPIARVEIPGLIQRVNKKGKVVDAWWQDGTAFRPEVLDGEGRPPGWAKVYIGTKAVVATAPPSATETGAVVAEAEPMSSEALELEALFHNAILEAGWLAEVDEKEFMSECPWAGDDVRAHGNMTTLYVNDEAFKVRGQKGRKAFSTVLYKCYETPAARRFKAWRTMRRSTNTFAGLSLLVVPAIFTVPSAIASGVAAGQLRKATVAAIEEQKATSKE